MKRMKKALAAVLLVCMLCPCISMIALAASAELRFTDPSTTVGAEVEVTAKLSSSSDLQSLQATLTYDANMLRFISGDSAAGGNGMITISGSGAGTSMDFILRFQALSEGTAKIDVSEASGTDASGAALEIAKGSSAVTIGPGDPSLIVPEEESGTVDTTGAQVEVDGVQYVVTSGFSDAVIPIGFTKGEMTFEGAACEVVTQSISGQSAMYLTPLSGGDADFFLYNSDNGTFAPFEQVEISQDRYIVLLRDDGTVELPQAYQQTTLTMNGKEFPAWQDTDHPEYYMVYALNADGQKTLYQYDTADKTYQRYVRQTETSGSTEENSAPNGLWNKILQLIEDYLDIIVIIGAFLFLLLMIILIVLAVKLRHRNLELDDLYDEYGIDVEEEAELPVKAVKEKKSAGGKSGPAVRMPVKKAKVEDDEDDFDDFDDLDEEDYDEDDGYDEDDAEDEDDEMMEELDDLLGGQTQKKHGHIEDDDTFKVDFIDLD